MAVNSFRVVKSFQIFENQPICLLVIANFKAIEPFTLENRMKGFHARIIPRKSFLRVAALHVFGCFFMQQQSFILSLRQRFRWLPKVSLPKLPSSICARTTEVSGDKLSAETSALPRVRKGFLPTSRLWALFQLPLHGQKVQPFLFCMEIRCRYSSVYVKSFRKTWF